MSKDVVQVTIADLSQFTKSLRAELSDAPSHVEMLSMVARAAGYRNFQHLRARNAPEPQSDNKKVSRAARYFDSEGRMASWPQKTSVQYLCVWMIWAQLPARTPLSERQISARIDALTAFRDPARLRRTLIEMKLFTRNLDGSVYERVETKLPPDAKALLARIKAGA